MFNGDNKAITYVVGGLLCAGLLLIGWTVQTSGMKVLAEDEERPPIIVKGGSLLFESGDSKKAKKGKPWKKETVAGDKTSEHQWKPVHQDAAPANVLKVAFEGGTGTCVAAYLPEFTVLYDPDGTGAKPQASYLVTRRARDNGKGTLAPAIIDAAGALTSDGSADYPTLKADGTNAFRIQFVTAGGSTVTCSNPTRVLVDSVQ